jgi:hypothetical protein
MKDPKVRTSCRTEQQRNHAHEEDFIMTISNTLTPARLLQVIAGALLAAAPSAFAFSGEMSPTGEKLLSASSSARRGLLATADADCQAAYEAARSNPWDLNQCSSGTTTTCPAACTTAIANFKTGCVGKGYNWPTAYSFSISGGVTTYTVTAEETKAWPDASSLKMYGNSMSYTSSSSQTYYGTLADNQKCFEEIWDVWVDNMPDCQTGIELLTNNIMSLSTLTYPNKTDWTQGFCGPLYSGALTCDPRCQAMIDKFDSVCTGQTYDTGDGATSYGAETMKAVQNSGPSACNYIVTSAAGIIASPIAAVIASLLATVLFSA